MVLEIGASIPSLSLPDQSGEERSLKELLGEKGAVIYFYPKDNTPGCTTEAQDFEALKGEFAAKGYTIIGISKDSVKSHTNFISKYDLSFTLLADVEVKGCEAFGVWQEKKNYGKTYMGIVRSTFVVDGDGVVSHVYKKVQVKEHAQKVLAALG
ncbi:alkyl hydroperoxide reductase/ Thiol specific antioxidant/ Mal allergen [Magnetococcus marinus MC-1]|uniref:thioredoxin-dependent peroxiredoxin n=1 Tax=Magnetococcus marinus (strain ATCC BAA-1437 / JCM 17883 / MC-1) TaxID=156889 RepID=A0L7N8_MAGMM|nr:thioredoxin-dependent thiol peroxidase [Magnetococcus marinus]ABK43981.1 alkyl hydroperoxide reductase/ Thiol specific antioxidant/ Mal allergen [Magnetococcus marinus MC-1]